jgi:hypothetical protein
MPGPPPKDPAARARRNRTSTAGVIDAAPARMPALGRHRPDSSSGSPIAWHPETRRWWRTIWSSAIAERWIDAHVPSIRALARLVDDFWKAPNPTEARQIHAEVRLASREFGLSLLAARSLNWELRRPAAAPEKQAAPLPPGTDPRSILTAPSARRVAGSS